METLVEYFSHEHLVRHGLRPKGKRTQCGEKVSRILPARPMDIARAQTYGSGTTIASCFDCILSMKDCA